MSEIDKIGVGCVFLSFALSMCWPVSASEQHVYEGSVHIRNADELSQFAAGGYAGVSGSLTIALEDDVKSLLGLESLQFVTEDVTIGCTYDYDGCNANLLVLSGLEGLTEIGGGLSITANLSLEDIDGLGMVSYIGEDVVIRENPQLMSLSGLSRISQIHGFLEVGWNDALPSLEGLEALERVEGGVVIGYNRYALTSLRGLESLREVGGPLFITGNYALLDVDALTSLESIGGHFQIAYNSVLSSLSGLSALEVVGGRFEIGFNWEVRSLEPLLGIREFGGDVAEIHWNVSLPICQSLQMFIHLEQVATQPFQRVYGTNHLGGCVRGKVSQ